MNENNHLVLKEIERVYGKIGNGYGVFLLECYIYYPYNEDCNMSYMLNGNDIGGIPRQSIKCNKPYPNNKLYRLSGINKNRVCKVGLPLIEKYSILNQIDTLTIFFDNNRNSIQLSIPLKISLNERKPFTYLHCSLGTDIVNSMARETSIQMIIRDPTSSETNITYICSKNPFEIKKAYLIKTDDEGDWIAYSLIHEIQLISTDHFVKEIAYANNLFE